MGAGGGGIGGASEREGGGSACACSSAAGFGGAAQTHAGSRALLDIDHSMRRNGRLHPPLDARGARFVGDSNDAAPVRWGHDAVFRRLRREGAQIAERVVLHHHHRLALERGVEAHLNCV